jgi:lysophospholipid acyltransferase (LPLAT)-like uncharacterized protein
MRVTWRRLVTWFARLYSLYFATLRVRGFMPDAAASTPDEYPFGPELLAACERDALVLAGLTARRGFTVLVAHGRDGDWAATALETLGCRVVRGSSRGGAVQALIDFVDALGPSGLPAAMVVDGPLGPAGQAKGGIIACAARTGRPVRAVGAAARWRVVFPHTWSGIYLPLPFSRVFLVCSEPMVVGKDASRAAVEAAARRLSDDLADTRARALAGVARRVPSPAAREVAPVSHR